jgi:hypothetical protein
VPARMNSRATISCSLRSANRFKCFAFGHSYFGGGGISPADRTHTRTLRLAHQRRMVFLPSGARHRSVGVTDNRAIDYESHRPEFTVVEAGEEFPFV